MVTKDKIFTNKASQITFPHGKWATLNSKEMGELWNNIPWKTIEERVNKLQSRITKATVEGKNGLAKKLQYLLTKSFFVKTKKERESNVAANVQKDSWLMNRLSGVR